MKIRLEIPGNRELPSQGRNSGSIPDGGTTSRNQDVKGFTIQAVNSFQPVQGAIYRAFLDPDEADVEFVFFVGWTASNERLVFEDGNGDLHVCTADEIDIGAA